MSKKTIIIFLLILNLIFMSLIIYYEKEDKKYISTLREKDNISMLKIVGEDTEIIKQVPQTGSWFMSYTCDDENAELYWNEKKRTVVAKNISSTECTLIFRESDAIFRMISMYVDGEYVTELDNTKKYEMESYECTNNEEIKWDIYNNKLSIEPIFKDTSCYVNFNEKITLYNKMLLDNNEQSGENIDYAYTSEGKIDSQNAPKSNNFNLNANPDFLTKENVKVKLTAIPSGYIIDETQIANGLYYTEDATEENERVYFYRGAVENNYAVFGNICWRIVRTVEDGSVRLRYGGTATKNGNTYTCPQTGTAVNIGMSVYHTSSTSSNDLNYKTSIIKNVIEDWYKENINFKSDGETKNISLTSLVADTPYCNDMTFGAKNRVNSSPQYKCPSSTYAYTVAKGDLKYPVGLLTADEVAYAGAALLEYADNETFYLYTGEGYWTMSPYMQVGSSYTLLSIDRRGLFGFGEATVSAAVYPVISLKNEAVVKKGTGLYNDPYVILTNE